MRRMVLMLVLSLCAATPATGQQLTRLQSRGAVLKGYRTVFGLTQTQLAVLTHISQTRISRYERGIDSARVGAEDTITAVLDSIFRARYHFDTDRWLVGMVTRSHMALLRLGFVYGVTTAFRAAITR